MSTPDGPRFERAGQLEGRGQFILAGDLVNRGAEPLADHGLITDYVPGERPDWAWEVENFLRTNFPQFRHMRFERLDSGDKLVKMTEKWLG